MEQAWENTKLHTKFWYKNLKGPLARPRRRWDYNIKNGSSKIEVGFSGLGLFDSG